MPTGDEAAGEHSRVSLLRWTILIEGVFIHVKGLAKYLGIATTVLALTTLARAESRQVNDTTRASQLVAAQAELQHTLDAKTAKQGDTVTAKLTESVHIADGTKLPRNTQLIGHIDEAQPAQNKGESKVVLTFDHARLANGQQIAIKSTIVNVSPEGSAGVVDLSLTPELEIKQAPTSRHGYGLTSSVAESNSGTLSANGKNVHLETGTELQFAVAPVAGANSAPRGN